jgi:hypothetical protein
MDGEFDEGGLPGLILQFNKKLFGKDKRITHHRSLLVFDNEKTD